MFIDGEIYILLHDNQSTSFLTGHVLASHDYRCDVFALVLIRVALGKEVAQEFPSAVGAERQQEATDLILKQDHQHHKAYTDDLV